jgi:hypothetical protein
MELSAAKVAHDKPSVRPCHDLLGARILGARMGEAPPNILHLTINGTTTAIGRKQRCRNDARQCAALGTPDTKMLRL